MEDRFIVIAGHGDDELFIHTTFPGPQRSKRRIIVTVIFGAAGRSSKTGRARATDSMRLGEMLPAEDAAIWGLV